MIDRASQLPEPELKVFAARFGYLEAHLIFVPRRLRDGKSFVAWAEAALRSSSVRRSLRLHRSLSMMTHQLCCHALGQGRRGSCGGCPWLAFASSVRKNSSVLDRFLRRRSASLRLSL